MHADRPRFLLLADGEDFAASGEALVWEARHGAFMLAQHQALRLPAITPGEALAAWQAADPLVLDRFGQIGRIAPDGRRFEYAPRWPAAGYRTVTASLDEDRAASAEALELDPVDAPGTARFTDLALGGPGLAALPYSDDAGTHGLVAVHLGRRWQRRCALEARPLRACVDGRANIWVADAAGLALCRGAPLPHPYTPDPERFEPVAVNPHPLRQRWRVPLPAGEGVLALAADGSRLYVLVWDARPEAPFFAQRLLVRELGERAGAPLAEYAVDPQVPFATDLAVVAPGRIALLCPRAPGDAAFRDRDCPVVRLTGEADPGPPRARLVRERYPQRGQRMARFVSSADGRTRYLGDDGPTELHPLPQARFPAEGEATVLAPLDAGVPDTLWHRIYLDACIPEGTGLELAVRGFEDWDARGEAPWEVQPRPLWVPDRSELPFHPGWQAPERGRKGLFEVLVQRPSGAVREVRGRYLQLRLRMRSDGRHSPAVRALRVYFPRRSWQEAYLPPHFHQQERPAPGPADPGVPGNGADLRQRLLASFEGLLGPVEERIAAAECLLYPQSAPAERLPALARLVGESPPGHWPLARRRRWIAAAGELQRRKGTFPALCRALDIATDGAVGLGRVVPVENFRLRRTLGTVLGVPMDDADHPLTLGTGLSGNSLVGDSLILGEEDAREVLALLAPEIAAAEASDRAKVEAFFEHYAHRLSVLLHGPARALEGAVRETLLAQAPAHVQWDVRPTDHPFVPGLSALLQIDTYLETRPAPRPVVLDHTRLGREGLLRNEPALAPGHSLAPRPSTGD